LWWGGLQRLTEQGNDCVFTRLRGLLVGRIELFLVNDRQRSEVRQRERLRLWDRVLLVQERSGRS
jgi:hypothetical protein